VPKFRMTYPYPRHWPDLGFAADPGEIIERDENPDPNHFEEVAEDRKAAKVAETEETA
jgi:hypothetical protein